MSKKIPILCECDGFDCKLSIKISFEEGLEAKRNENNVIIINGCQTGPNPTDVLISKEKGYTIYRD